MLRSSTAAGSPAPESAVVNHLDLPAVERALRQNRTGRAWVVTESYFSMDADSPTSPRLRQLCDEHGAALFVDEAHALGVFGPRRAGALRGTGGRARRARRNARARRSALAGAFVAGSEALTAWLWNRARSFVFSTGVSPATAKAALRSLRSHRQGDERRHAWLHANAARLRTGLEPTGALAAGTGRSSRSSSATSAPRASRGRLPSGRQGVHVQAVRPPTVPAGTPACGSRRRRCTPPATSTILPSEAIERTLPWPTPSS